MRTRAIARAAGVAGVALAAASCLDYRLTDPVPTGPPPEPPPPPAAQFTSLGATLFIEHGDSARYLFRATFARDAAAIRPGVVRDSSIVVGDTRVAPAPPGGAYLRYEWRETRPAATPLTGVLVVRGPELADGGAATFEIPLLAREGDVAAPAPGEDLRLRVLSAPLAPSLERRDATWSLEVGSACASVGAVQYVRQFSTGAVPTEVLVSHSVLPEPLPPLVACLGANAFYSVAGAPYRTGFNVAPRLVWRVPP